MSARITLDGDGNPIAFERVRPAASNNITAMQYYRETRRCYNRSFSRYLTYVLFGGEVN